MMRRAMLIAAAALAAAAPLQAQQEEAYTPAFSAEDDLDCAIFIGAIMAELEAEMTPDNQIGLTSALTYFVGRYEAQRGTDLMKAFTERYPAYQQRNPAEIEQTCSVRMRSFASRLQVSGSALTALQPPRGVEPQPGSPPED